MRLLNYSGALAAIFFSTLSAANQSSLCSTSEVTYFACSVDTKLVSLCASKDFSSTSGTLQYRFGKQSDKVELAYPSSAKPKDAFKAYTSSFAKGGVAVIGFKIGKYSYSVFETRSVYGYNGAGVTITKDGVSPKIIECKTIPTTPSRFYYELGNWGLPTEVDLQFIGTER